MVPLGSWSINVRGASWMSPLFSHISWRESITVSTITDIPLTFSTSIKPCPGRSRNTRLNQADIKASSSLRWKCIMTTSSCSRNPRFHLPSWTTHFRKTMWMRCPSTMYRVPARRCPICAAWGTGRLDISAARSGSTALTSGIMPSSTSSGAWEAFSTRSMWLTWGILRRM